MGPLSFGYAKTVIDGLASVLMAFMVVMTYLGRGIRELPERYDSSPETPTTGPPDFAEALSALGQAARALQGTELSSQREDEVREAYRIIQRLAAEMGITLMEPAR